MASPRIAHWVRQQMAARALQRIQEAMPAVDFLAVKGFVTARTLYASPGERPMSDLDTRIQPSDLTALIRAAERHGWLLERRSAQWATVGLFLEGMHVEVETTIGPPFVCRWSVADVLRRAQRREDASGLRYWAPELHDLALILCLNVYKDHLDSPSWAFDDLARVVEAKGFSATAFAQRVSGGGCRSAVALAARHLARRYPGSRWVDIAMRLPAPPAFGWLYERTRHARPVARMLVGHCGGDAATSRLAGLGVALLGAGAWKVRKLRGEILESAPTYVPTESFRPERNDGPGARRPAAQHEGASGGEGTTADE